MRYFLSKYLFHLCEDIICSNSKVSEHYIEQRVLLVWAPRGGLEILYVSLVSSSYRISSAGVGKVSKHVILRRSTEGL